MKVKTSELTGPALDWTVAKAESELAEQGGQVHLVGGCLRLYNDTSDEPWHPSTNWAQGGPILDFRMMTVGPAMHEGYEARAYPYGKVYWGDTPLEAAMRCVVSSVLGDEIEVPDCLKD